MSADGKGGMVAFRSSRRGYDRADVNRYIEEMSIRFTAAETAMKNRIRELEERLKEAEAARPAGPAGNAEAEGKPEASPDAEAARNDAPERNEAAQDPAAERGGEEAGNAAETIKKAAPAEEERQLCERLGRILLRANLDAERIVAEAGEDAAKQLAEAVSRADRLQLDAAVTARLMTGQVREKLLGMTGDFLEGMSGLSEEAVGRYRAVLEEMRLGFETLRHNAAMRDPKA